MGEDRLAALIQAGPADLAPLIGSGHLLFCRIVRKRIRGWWCFEAQFVLDGKAPQHLVGAREGYGLRRQDIAPSPEVERAGLAPGKPRVTRRHPPGRRSRVRIAKRLERAARGQRSDGVVREKPKPATEHGTSAVPQDEHGSLG